MHFLFFFYNLKFRMFQLLYLPTVISSFCNKKFKKRFSTKPLAFTLDCLRNTIDHSSITVYFLIFFSKVVFCFMLRDCWYLARISMTVQENFHFNQLIFVNVFDSPNINEKKLFLNESAQFSMKIIYIIIHIDVWICSSR